MRGHVLSTLVRRDLLHRIKLARSNSRHAPKLPELESEGSRPLMEHIDPRPPWLYNTSAMLRVLFVPIAIIYGVFVHDFGEGEHVFKPPRRWWERQKATFFTLSPAEQELVDADRVQDETPSEGVRTV